MKPIAFLIDTDWVIEHLRGRRPVTQRLRQLEEQGLAISVITLAELWEGVYYSRDPARSQAGLEEFVSGVAVLGLDEEICRRFGRLRGSLRKQGKLIGDFDLLIAGSALEHQLTLLTNNRRHFENIEELRIETLPDWKE
jgi:tRNA(fMet)-specific endonuclease VapC